MVNNETNYGTIKLLYLGENKLTKNSLHTFLVLFTALAHVHFDDVTAQEPIELLH